MRILHFGKTSQSRHYRPLEQIPTPPQKISLLLEPANKNAAEFNKSMASSTCLFFVPSSASIVVPFFTSSRLLFPPFLALVMTLA
mmetsp:Transcript_24711/g.52458  ORF Transcript_24711/g.52458 Transcript_24711/m.52458 type:complete len:85 (+) Transcript_24711:131-385(+)